MDARYCEPTPAYPSILSWQPRGTRTDSTGNRWLAPRAGRLNAPPSLLPSRWSCPKGSRSPGATGGRPDAPHERRRRTSSDRMGNRFPWPTAGVPNAPPRRRLRTSLSPRGSPSEHQHRAEKRNTKRGRRQFTWWMKRGDRPNRSKTMSVLFVLGGGDTSQYLFEAPIGCDRAGRLLPSTHWAEEGEENKTWMSGGCSSGGSEWMLQTWRGNKKRLCCWFGGGVSCITLWVTPRTVHTWDQSQRGINQCNSPVSRKSLSER